MTTDWQEAAEAERAEIAHLTAELRKFMSLKRNPRASDMLKRKRQAEARLATAERHLQTEEPQMPDTFTAHVSLDEGELTMLVNRSIPGGIDGPFTTPVVVTGMSLDRIERKLTDQGFYLDEPWNTTVAYDGLRLSAKVTR